VKSDAAEVAWREWMQNLARQVRRRREFLGLTQQELGRRAGVSQGAVSRFEGGRAFNTPFLAIVRLNVALARALRALDAATLSEDARRYLRYMEFLATPPEASEAGGTPLPERVLTPDPEGEAWMRLYWEVPPRQRPSLLTMARAAADVLRE
jgi:transcriptional regulator with XRE-family HTH domain